MVYIHLVENLDMTAAITALASGNAALSDVAGAVAWVMLHLLIPLKLLLLVMQLSPLLLLKVEHLPLVMLL